MSRHPRNNTQATPVTEEQTPTVADTPVVESTEQEQTPAVIEAVQQEEVVIDNSSVGSLTDVLNPEAPALEVPQTDAPVVTETPVAEVPATEPVAEVVVPVVEVISEVAVVVAPVREMEPLTNSIASVTETTVVAVEYSSKLEERCINTILAAMDAIKPGRPVTTDLGARHQTAIYRAIQDIINKSLSYDEFKSGFDKIVKLFLENNNFNDRYIFRFTEALTMSKPDNAAFLRIFQLIKTLADVRTRKVALNQVNLNFALEYGVTEDGRQRVTQYFTGK